MVKKIFSHSIVWILLAVLFGFVAGRWFVPSPAEEKPEKHEAVISDWTCSMHPQIRQKEPGSCPICGMDLIPVSQMGSSPVVLEMTDEAIKLANVQTTKVRFAEPQKEILLQGKVKSDERLVSIITARFGGRLEKLDVDFTGMTVQKGQKLGSIYSPELITAQQELFEAIKYQETNPVLFSAAKNKLRLWNITDQQIDEIVNGGTPKTVIDILAPLTGVVMKRQVSLGQYVKEGTPLFEIVDLSRVWVLFDAYESDLSWLKLGDEIRYTIASLPGEEFSGKITFIDPVINHMTRSASVRLETYNPGMRLKPEMFANGLVMARLPIKDSKMVVPKTSVLWTGKRAVVYVKVEDVHQPTFHFREIELGPELGTDYVVESGLSPDEEVVFNGVFKVDAAAQLAGKQSMMNDVGVAGYKGSIHAPEAFRQQLTLLFNSYVGLKNALVDSDVKSAQVEAAKVAGQLGKVEMHLLSPDAHKPWMEFHDKIKSSLSEIKSGTEIASLRADFIPLSEAMANAIEVFGVHGITIFKDYCPMADENRGAIWLSEVKEIRNPYFGEKMLKCGEVRQTFEGKPKTETKKPMSGHQH